jgi:transposase
MRAVHLTPDERKELIQLEKHIPHKGVGIRIRIILALDDGYAARDVARILLLDEDTVTKWKKRYEASTLLSDWLGDENDGYMGKLNEEQEKLVEKMVRTRVITDCREVADYIKGTFGISYTIAGVTKLLHRLAFVYKQTVVVPAKADRERQERFLTQYEELKTNLKETEKILFMDGVHPTHNTRAVRCWVKRGENKQIKTNAARERLNIQGVLDLEQTEVRTHFSKTIDAVAVMHFFDEIQLAYAHLTRIYLICDNARYYKNRDVQAYLKQDNCSITLIHLPTYSPNLNFIERLWKYLHQKIIGVTYREKFKQFEADIKAFFANIQDYKTDLQPFIGTRLRLMQA